MCPKFICWSPNPPCGCIGGRAFKEVIKAKWGHKGGGLVWWKWCNYKRKRHQDSPPFENKKRRWLSASQEESSHHEPNWLVPWSQTSQPPELWENKLLLFKPPSLWYMLWQSELRHPLLHPPTLPLIYPESFLSVLGKHTESGVARPGSCPSKALNLSKCEFLHLHRKDIDSCLLLLEGNKWGHVYEIAL